MLNEFSEHMLSICMSVLIDNGNLSTTTLALDTTTITVYSDEPFLFTAANQSRNLSNFLPESVF